MYEAPAQRNESSEESKQTSDTTGGAAGGPLADALNARPAVQLQMQLDRTLNGGIVQRTLTIDGSVVTADDINKKSAYKKRLNKILSEEGAAYDLTPNSLRSALTAMAEDGTNHVFATKRDAVRAVAEIEDAEADLADATDDVEEFDDFPVQDLWRLMMDGKHQAARGKFGFENERGYMSAMMRAFTHMLENLEDDLTVASYEELHDIAVEGVYSRGGELFKQGYRNSMYEGEGFGVDAETYSEEGHEELREKYRARNDGDERYPEGHPVGMNLARAPDEMVGEGTANVMRIKPMARNQCLRFAKAVLDVFDTEIEAAGDDEDAKLEAIARCAQDLDQLHLFADGNIRTIAFLVVNKLLLQNDMDPVILHEPNIFDLKSVDELKAALREGQQAFAAYKNH